MNVTGSDQCETEFCYRDVYWRQGFQWARQHAGNSVKQAGPVQEGRRTGVKRVELEAATETMQKGGEGGGSTGGLSSGVRGSVGKQLQGGWEYGSQSNNKQGLDAGSPAYWEVTMGRISGLIKLPSSFL